MTHPADRRLDSLLEAQSPIQVTDPECDQHDAHAQYPEPDKAWHRTGRAQILPDRWTKVQDQHCQTAQDPSQYRANHIKRADSVERPCQHHGSVDHTLGRVLRGHAATFLAFISRPITAERIHPRSRPNSIIIVAAPPAAMASLRLGDDGLSGSEGFSSTCTSG